MGLIEKAGGYASEPAPRPTAAAGETSLAAPIPFDIDFAALAAQGFYSPDERTSKLSLELRSIKRRLLRRTGLRNAIGEKRLVRRGGRQRNLILVTSTRPGEGKTFCAINLALSLACEEEMDVLLIDADTPRPKVRSHFGLPEAKGLTDRLSDPTIPVASLCWRARNAPLTILPEGAPLDRPGDLLASGEAQRLFTEISARRAGRLVLIDAPPTLAADEATILARHVDEVIFIVEADATPQAAVAAALDEILEINPNVSLVLNRCLIGASASYYGSYSDYETNRPTASPPGADMAAESRRI